LHQRVRAEEPATARVAAEKTCARSHCAGEGTGGKKKKKFNGESNRTKGEHSLECREEGGNGGREVPLSPLKVARGDGPLKGREAIKKKGSGPPLNFLKEGLRP